MARIRTTKPEFWGDDIVGSVSRDARLLFVATWNFADDEGLIRWSPEYLKPEVFRYDQDLAVEDVAALMRELEDAGFVYAYSTSRARSRIGFIVNFRRHQRVDKPQGAKNPTPNWRDPAVAMVYARRDGFVCSHCKEPVNEQYSPQWRRFDPVCELVKPRSEGGTDDPTNIAVVHVMCAKDYDPEGGPTTPHGRLAGAFQEDSTNVPGTLQDRSGDPFEGSAEPVSKALDPRFGADPDLTVSAGHEHSWNVPGTFGAGKEGIRERKGREEEEPSSSVTATPPPDATPAIKPKSKSAKKHATEPRPDVEALCNRLVEMMAARGCRGASKDAITDRWRDQARLLLDKDGVHPQFAMDVLEWSQRSEFWKPNILSMPKFREKWNTLYQQAERECGPHPNRPQDAELPTTENTSFGGNVVRLPAQRPSTTDQRVAQAKAAGQRFAAAFRAAQQANIQGAV